MYCMPIISGFEKSGPGAKEFEASLGYVRPSQGGGEGEESKSHKVYFFLFFLFYIGNFPERQMSVGFFFSYEIYLKTL